MTPVAATSTCRAASASAAASRSLDLGPSKGPRPPAMGLRRQSRLRPDAISLFLLAGVVFAGCHSSRGEPAHAERPAGTWHVVAPGESLETIAKRADVPMADLLEINGLADPAEVRPGRLIFVLASPLQSPATPAGD